MSKIKNGGLDQYRAEPFEQQQFGTAGVEGVKFILRSFDNQVPGRRGEHNSPVPLAMTAIVPIGYAFVNIMLPRLFVSPRKELNEQMCGLNGPHDTWPFR